MNLDLRVGRIVDVQIHEKARGPMYKLKVNLGDEIGERTLIAGIRNVYTKEELMGKLIICVTNLDPKQIGGIESHGMLLAAEDNSTISILTVDKAVREGSRVH